MKQSIFICFIIFLGNQIKTSGQDVVHVLILSGSNNHQWEATTPALKNIFNERNCFTVRITNQPDTLTYPVLKEFDALISNWNSWPDNDLRWPEKTETAISDFIKKGGGFITFHSSTSAFYKWPEFNKFSTASWVEDTYHGEKSATEVRIIDEDHPVTRGLHDFFIFDELWINAEKNENFKVLGTATNTKIQEKGIPDQPAIFVSEYGKGRIFHTILGHDVRAIRNPGFQLLMLKGTEWAATGKVTQPVFRELKTVKSKTNFHWLETDTSFALLNGDQIIWQYNFNTRYGKPFFHPVFIGRNDITCISPDDHPWHLGQWFSWKFINNVNYWEYKKGTLQSAGVTEVDHVEIKKNDDYSAEIRLHIAYHPASGEKVLSENRTIRISPPYTNGNMWMEYELSFEAIADEVELNRTPILGQENGKSWGGYAGLSVRFNQAFMNPDFITPWNDNDSINGRNGDWLYMGFTGIDGHKIGSQIMIHPESQRKGGAWYSVVDEKQPFYYFSPAYLYYKPIILKKGDGFTLKYKILHLQGETKRQTLDMEYKNYLNNKNQF